MEALRVGFIGCGSHSGLRLYPGLEEAGLELVAVCDLDQEKARSRAARYGAKHVYDDYETMCHEQQLDAVLVVTGPRGHYELTKALLALGYHVWTEKPCAETSAQADELVELAAKAGRIVQTGFNYRYTLGVQRAVTLMEQQRFAEPATVSVRWWLGESDTTKFMQHYVCHGVDLLHYLTPGGLTHVDPVDGMHVEYQRQDDCDWYVATLRGTSGCIAVLELGAHMSGEGLYCSVDLMSKDGLLRVTDFTQLVHYDTAPWGNLKTPGCKVFDGDHVWRTEPLLTRGGVWQTFGYTEELQRFREAIQGVREAEATVREAAWGMHVMDQLMAKAQH
ncbi:MAG: Gfo/Idh/MocA family oxidoreductase [Pirellulaceae bacterium]|nr:Gfo/Idh/MocA family oxidoreductase [Pirellulaceae bacterium]